MLLAHKWCTLSCKVVQGNSPSSFTLCTLYTHRQTVRRIQCGIWTNSPSLMRGVWRPNKTGRTGGTACCVCSLRREDKSRLILTANKKNCHYYHYSPQLGAAPTEPRTAMQGKQKLMLFCLKRSKILFLWYTNLEIAWLPVCQTHP